MKHRNLWIVLLLVLAFVFTACGGGAEPTAAPEVEAQAEAKFHVY